MINTLPSVWYKMNSNNSPRLVQSRVRGDKRISRQVVYQPTLVCQRSIALRPSTNQTRAHLHLAPPLNPEWHVTRVWVQVKSQKYLRKWNYYALHDVLTVKAIEATSGGCRVSVGRWESLADDMTWTRNSNSSTEIPSFRAWPCNTAVRNPKNTSQKQNILVWLQLH